MVVPCALMCMPAARASMVVEAIAVRCSCSTVFCACVGDSPERCMRCSHAWNNIRWKKTHYKTACGQIEALYPVCASLICHLCSPRAAVLHDNSVACHEQANTPRISV